MHSIYKTKIKSVETFLNLQMNIAKINGLMQVNLYGGKRLRWQMIFSEGKRQGQVLFLWEQIIVEEVIFLLWQTLPETSSRGSNYKNDPGVRL